MSAPIPLGVYEGNLQAVRGLVRGAESAQFIKRRPQHDAEHPDLGHDCAFHLFPVSSLIVDRPGVRGEVPRVLDVVSLRPAGDVEP